MREIHHHAGPEARASRGPLRPSPIRRPRTPPTAAPARSPAAPALRLCEEALQRVELALPELPVARDPLEGVSHGLVDEAAAAGTSLLGALDEARSLEHRQVLGDRGQRHVEWLRKLPDRGVALRQLLHDRPAGWIGESPEGRIQRSTLNHLVKDRIRPRGPDEY